MKHFFVVILILITSVITARAQSANPKYTPGDLLIQANKLKIQSTLLGIGSAGMLTTVSVVYANYPETEEGILILGALVGVGMGIGSVSANFKAWKSIAEAGKLMNEKGITLQPTKEGAGLVYRF